MDDAFEPTREHARERDHAAPLALADRFSLPDPLYLDGNSLGPLSDAAEAAVESVLEEWRELGIRAWTDADPPWFHYGEHLGDRLAPLVGARPDEVVAANSTTVNIHTLLGTFLDRCAREGRGRKVLVDALDFPTDHYAIRGQLQARGLDPDEHLVVVESDDGRTVSESAVESALDAHPEVGIVFLPSVLYRSGQLLDVERLTRAAHDHDAYAGFDLAHTVGLVPHELAGHGVDFAVWCTYKYLNAGPGSIGGLYVNRAYHGEQPGLPGWWGHEKESQFEMRMQYTPAETAGAWQIGTVPVLAAAPLLGVLDLVEAAGLDRLRERSVALTAYLIALVDERLPSCTVGTPREADRRGGHVAIEHPEAYRLGEALKDRGVVVDVRPPDVVRLCPSPYFVGFEDVYDAVDILHDVLDERAYEAYGAAGDGVT
ncbi:MAG: kynureninase [Halobacteriales archaeon]|nr:kynureninase [Halobacteriales archaeon]